MAVCAAGKAAAMEPRMHRLLPVAIALALAAGPLAAIAGEATAPPAVEATTQLPREVRPTHYDISVVPHADRMTFDGRVAIAIEVLQPTDRIVLNAVDMVFAKATLAPAGGGPAVDAKVVVDADAQTATITIGKPIAAGSHVLTLDYSGKIGTQAAGLFALDYDTPSGRKRALYTQFEAADARRFIPSWDEPNHKATFTLQATVPATQMVVSNMPEESSKDLGNGLKRVSFPPSPKMSTYLLFFAAGEFDRATAKQDGTELGVVTQKGKADQAAFALQSQQEILRDFNDYFGVPYPLPKLDNIAAPGSSQFFSAMENWGAIFTFEHSLLLDPSIATVADRQGVFSVDAHEMAHQWFGDLVTMSWWDDLWLNEGFASWMAGRTTAKLHPEWNTALNTVFGREGAMARDAIVTTHPVVQHIETVAQAGQAFDAITYSKGSAVIRMLEAYVGGDDWREGVRSYIGKHAYGNTVSDDLWNAIEAAAGKPIKAIAHDFTLQPGVPLIRVVSASCDGGNTTLQLEQGEFTRDRPGKQPLSWRVPVIAQVVGAEPARSLVVGGKGTLQLPGCGAVVVNAGQSGYYRTLYAPELFATLKASFADLATIDQLGTLANTRALGMAGAQAIGDYLDLVKAVRPDADPVLWESIAGALASLHEAYRGDDARQARFAAFAIDVLRPVFTRIGWEAKPGESAPATNLRTTLIETLGELGDRAVVDEANRRFAANDDAALPPELRLTILGVVARNADAATWDRLHAMARAETTPLVKDNLYALLTRARDEALARRALELALTDEPGATNSAGMIRGVAHRHPGLAFDFALAHRTQVDPLVDSTSRSRYYPDLGGGSIDPAMIDKIGEYADKYIAASSRRAAETAIAGIRDRLKVRSEILPGVDAWLQGQAD